MTCKRAYRGMCAPDQLSLGRTVGARQVGGNGGQGGNLGVVSRERGVGLVKALAKHALVHVHLQAQTQGVKTER